MAYKLFILLALSVLAAVSAGSKDSYYPYPKKIIPKKVKSFDLCVGEIGDFESVFPLDLLQIILSNQYDLKFLYQCDDNYEATGDPIAVVQGSCDNSLLYTNGTAIYGSIPPINGVTIATDGALPIIQCKQTFYFQTTGTVAAKYLNKCSFGSIYNLVVRDYALIDPQQTDLTDCLENYLEEIFGNHNGTIIITAASVQSVPQVTKTLVQCFEDYYTDVTAFVGSRGADFGKTGLDDVIFDSDNNKFTFSYGLKYGPNLAYGSYGSYGN